MRAQYYAEYQRPVSFATKELGLLLHITTYYAQYRTVFWICLCPR